MEIHLTKNADGLLLPSTERDEEGLRHLKVGETYSASIRLVRNGMFHRKYFKMMSLAWEYLPEAAQAFFHSEHGFRKYVEIAAGYYDTFYSNRLQEFVEGPKSIAYDKLDQAEFEDLYMKVRTVLDSILTRYITQEQFDKTFLPF